MLFCACNSSETENQPTRILEPNEDENELVTIANEVSFLKCLDSSIIDTFVVPVDGLSYRGYTFKSNNTFESIGFTDISDYFEKIGTYQIINDTILILNYTKRIRSEKVISKKGIIAGEILEQTNITKIDTLFIDYSGQLATICIYSDMYDGDKNLISKFGKLKCKRINTTPQQSI